MAFEALISVLGLLFNISFSKWSVNQKANLTTQLQSGIRYFDIRVAIKADSCGGLTSNSSSSINSCFFLVHGQYGNRVEKELEVIRHFLEEHPKEVVIIDFQHFYGLDAAQKEAFTRLVRKVFGEMLEPYTPQIPTLVDMWSRKKQVITLGYEKKADSVAVGVSILWPRSAVRQPWPNTRSPQVLNKFLSKAFNAWMPISRPQYFFVFQGILSPNLDYILLNSVGGLEKLATLANAVVEKWLNGLTCLRGVVITDFAILGFPNFARLVFSMNW